MLRSCQRRMRQSVAAKVGHQAAHTLSQEAAGGDLLEGQLMEACRRLLALVEEVRQNRSSWEAEQNRLKQLELGQCCLI